MFKLLFKVVIKILIFELHKLLSDFIVNVMKGLRLVSWPLNCSELLIKERMPNNPVSPCISQCSEMGWIVLHY